MGEWNSPIYKGTSAAREGAFGRGAPYQGAGECAKGQWGVAPLDNKAGERAGRSPSLVRLGEPAGRRQIHFAHARGLHRPQITKERHFRFGGHVGG